MFRKLTAIVVFVKDLATCTAFYLDTLALPETFRDEVSIGFKMGDQDFLLLKETAAAEMVGDRALEQGAGHRVLLCIGVENVDEACAALTAKGVALIKPPKDQAWGRRTSYFADPEGNLWELWQEI